MSSHTAYKIKSKSRKLIAATKTLLQWSIENLPALVIRSKAFVKSNFANESERSIPKTSKTGIQEKQTRYQFQWWVRTLSQVCCSSITMLNLLCRNGKEGRSKEEPRHTCMPAAKRLSRCVYGRRMRFQTSKFPCRLCDGYHHWQWHCRRCQQIFQMCATTCWLQCVEISAQYDFETSPRSFLHTNLQIFIKFKIVSTHHKKKLSKLGDNMIHNACKAPLERALALTEFRPTCFCLYSSFHRIW